METGTYVTTNIILSDVLKRVDDEKFLINSEGYYRSLVQQALEGLAIDSFFDKRHEDYDFPAQSLNLPMPRGAFNIKEIFLYHGNEFNIGRSQNVYWKRNFITNGNGYTAKAKEGQPDPFHSTAFRRADFWIDKALHNLPVTSNNPSLSTLGSFNFAYFCNIQNGMIMFSSVCRNFEKVRIMFNGTGCDIGDVPMIPVIFRRAVADHATVAALEIRMAKEPQKWGPLLKYWDGKLNGTKSGFDGSWYEAKYLAKTMHSKFREDIGEYLSKLNY